MNWNSLTWKLRIFFFFFFRNPILSTETAGEFSLVKPRHLNMLRCILLIYNVSTFAVRCVTHRNHYSSTFLLKPLSDIFPFCLQTYNSDAQIGESSACATALLCGVKANFETVGLDSSGRFENCFSSFSSRVPSLFDWAQQAGKWNYVNRWIMFIYQWL